MPQAPAFKGDLPPEEIVREVAIDLGLRPGFAIDLAWDESRLFVNRTSPAGARGLMQLMPVAIVRYGVTDPFDAKQSAKAGLTYLKELLGKYGSEKRARCAYGGWPKHCVN